MTRSQWGFLVFVTLASIAAVGFAFFYRSFAGVSLYDYNFTTFQEVLTDEQKTGLMRSLDSVTATYTLLIVMSNLLWAAATWYLLLKVCRKICAGSSRRGG